MHRDLLPALQSTTYVTTRSMRARLLAKKFNIFIANFQRGATNADALVEARTGRGF